MTGDVPVCGEGLAGLLVRINTGRELKATVTAEGAGLSDRPGTGRPGHVKSASDVAAPNDKHRESLSTQAQIRPKDCQVTGSPYSTSAASTAPITSSRCLGASPNPGRTLRTASAVTRSPALSGLTK